MKHLVDLHVHTGHSFDSEERIENHCRRASELGLAAFAVTDHCDVNMQPLSEAVKNIRASGADVFRMREEGFPGVLAGVELGEPLEDAAKGT